MTTWPIHANLYLVTYRRRHVPLHHSDLRPELMIYIVLLQCFVLPWAWAVVLRGTANLPITPWIWDDTALRHDHLMHSVKQASVWLVISCIFSWSTVSAQESIGHVFHAKYPSSSANLHNTSELWPPYLLIGLHGQCTHILGPFWLVSVVGCKWEWTILVCGRDWLWLCLYVMLGTVCTRTISFILWHSSNACLTANDYFLSDFC